MLTLAELLLTSDLGRANPERVRELLDRAADPLMEERDAPVEKDEETDLAAA